MNTISNREFCWALFGITIAVLIVFLIGCLVGYSACMNDAVKTGAAKWTGPGQQVFQWTPAK